MISNRLMTVILFFTWIIAIGAGNLEGQFFPPSHKMKLVETEVIGGRTHFIGESEKIRFGCDHRATNWYLGSRDGEHAPADFNMDAAIIQPNGAYRIIGASVNVVPDEVFKTNTFADSYYKCRIFYRMEMINGSMRAVGGIRLPWITVSRFYN